MSGRNIGSFVEKLLPFFQVELNRANLKIKSREYLSMCIFSNTILFILTAIILTLIFSTKGNYYLGILLALIFSGIIFFMQLNYPKVIAHKRIKLLDADLLSALRAIMIQLNAGMTPDKALLLSARPEFGPLKTEIDIVGKEVTLGKNIGTALMEMTTRVKSKRLIRAIELINSGLDSGGSLSTLLQATSNDLREQLLVDKKIKANITMYTIFIFSAAAIIIPTLFGLSSYLVEVLQVTLSTIDIPSSASTSLPINIGGIEITTEFLSMYIVVFIIVNSLMASMILGLIEKGKHIAGFRFFIPMVAMAIPIFFIVKYAIKSGLGGLFGM